MKCTICIRCYLAVTMWTQGRSKMYYPENRTEISSQRFIITPRGAHADVQLGVEFSFTSRLPTLITRSAMEDHKLISSTETPQDVEMSIIKMILIASLQLGLCTVQGSFSLIMVPFETDSTHLVIFDELI